MTTPPVQGWLPEAGARALHTVRRHIAAETTADTDAICATVSRNVFFAVPQRTRAGQELPPGSVLTHWDEVYDYYAARADQYVVLASSQLASISTSWYVLNESAATLRTTGGLGTRHAKAASSSDDDAGREFVVNSAILFPTADDGIRGEICITRHPFEDVLQGTVQVPRDASGAREHATLLDGMLASLPRGPAAIRPLLAPHHSLALRLDDAQGQPHVHTATTPEAACEVLASIAHGARDAALVSRLVSDWYVFGEYALPLASGGVRRVALLHSVESGAFTSCFGYGRDEP